jgi:hypothetical protein
MEPTGKRMPIHISTTVELEEDTSSIVKQRRSVDVVMQLMLVQISMIQIEDQTFTNSQLTMASLVNSSTTTPNKKANVSMTMVRE